MNIIEVLNALDTTPLQQYEYGELVCNHINLLIPDEDPVNSQMTGQDILTIVNGLDDSIRLKLYQARVPATTQHGVPITPTDLKNIQQDPESLPRYTRSYLSTIGIGATVAAVVIGFVGLMAIMQRGGELDESSIKAVGGVFVDVLRLVMGQ